jgi:hypothetical protein
MDDDIRERPPEQPSRRTHLLTPSRIAAVLALVLLALGLRRHFRFALNVFRHRRRLQLAFGVLLLLRQLRTT